MSFDLPGAGTLPHLLQRPVTVLRVDRAGVIDEYGNQRPAVVERIERWAFLEAITEEEVTVDENTYEASWRIFLPPGTPLDPWDRVEVDDLTEIDSEGHPRVATFEVIGVPDRPRRPWMDLETQVRAYMRRVTA